MTRLRRSIDVATVAAGLAMLTGGIAIMVGYQTHYPSRRLYRTSHLRRIYLQRCR